MEYDEKYLRVLLALSGIPCDELKIYKTCGHYEGRGHHNEQMIGTLLYDVWTDRLTIPTKKWERPRLADKIITKVIITEPCRRHYRSYIHLGWQEL